MDDLKLPLFLLIAILGGVGFYIYQQSQKQPVPNVKSSKKIVRTVDEDEESKKKSKQADNEELIETVKDVFEKGNYEKTLEMLSGHENDNSYDILRMMAYSYASTDEPDKAIITFEKALKLRKIPVDGYSLGYMYEKTGRLEAAASLYMELAGLKLPANLRRSVYEGVARIAWFFPENEDMLAIIRNLVKTWPDSYDGSFGLIKLLKAKKSYDGIENISETNYKGHSDDYMYNFSLGELYFEAEKDELATKCFSKCTKLDKQNYAPYLYLHKLMKRNGKKSLAQTALMKFMESKQVYPELFFDAAMDAIEDNEYIVAFKFYLSAISCDKKLLGKNDNELVSKVEKYLKSSGSELDNKMMMAVVSYLNGDYNYALEELNRLKPELDKTDYADSIQRIIWECEVLDSIDKKRESDLKAYEDYLRRKEEKKLKKANKVNPGKDIAVKRLENASEISEEELKTKAVKAPKDYEIQMQVGLEMAARGKTKDAKVFFKNASLLRQNAAEPHVEIAKLCLAENDTVGAEMNLSSALLANDSNSNALALSATLNFSKNNLSRAKSLAERSLSIDSNNSQANVILAKIYIKENDFARAEGCIEKALISETDKKVRAELLKMKRMCKE